MLNNLLIANSKEELLQVRSLAQMGGKIRKDKMSMWKRHLKNQSQNLNHYLIPKRKKNKNISPQNSLNSNFPK